MRLLIAVGCNAYDHFTPLGGAEADAERMFNVLLRPEVGDYDPSHSKLLKSPTAAEVQAALRDLLSAGDAVDTFTLFFAGHGAVANGGFHMLLRDSQPGLLSVSALSMSHLFTILNELKPLQSNIIIDACESGGLIADLGALLKPELLGDEGSPAVTLLATAAQDQDAYETDLAGHGTSAIIDCLEGRDVVSETAPALDLAQIGRHISIRLREETGQSPVVWGLNLYGAPRFCRNPRFGADPTRPLRDVIQAWPHSSQIAIETHYDGLWHVYASASGEWDPRAFARAVDPVLLALRDQPAAFLAFAERLSSALADRARESIDAFRAAEVRAALLVSFLPHLTIDGVSDAADRLGQQVALDVLEAAEALDARLIDNPYALVSAYAGGLSDLFYVPIRIAKVLGWTAAAAAMAREPTSTGRAGTETFRSLLSRLLELYPLAIQAISDLQSSAFAIAIGYARRIGATNEVETLVGSLFLSLVTTKGGIARGDLPGTDVFKFLMARRAGEYEPVMDCLERPPELSTVVLLSAAKLGLDEAVDPALWELDGHHFHAFVSAAFDAFGAEMISDGSNLMFAIGRDVFRIADLEAALSPQIEGPSGVTREAVLLASLVYPDRVPWFILAEEAVSTDAV